MIIVAFCYATADVTILSDLCAFYHLSRAVTQIFDTVFGDLTAVLITN